MPNIKIYIDTKAHPKAEAAIAEILPQFRDLLCESLLVGPSACQMAILSVQALQDQPDVNVELMILPSPHRTRDVLEKLGKEIQSLLNGVTGLHIAVRVAQLDPASYVALK